jgi:hypothetical protein
MGLAHSVPRCLVLILMALNSIGVYGFAPGLAGTAQLRQLGLLVSRQRLVAVLGLVLELPLANAISSSGRIESGFRRG